MKKKLFLFLSVAIAALSLSSCGYNSMVELDETVQQKWANVESQYQRRADLVPNLVNTVKGAADFEKETLTQVIEARASATQVKVDPSKLDEASIQKYQKAQGKLSSALGRLLVSVERYPDLKANQNFRDLQAQLEGTGNRINFARDQFNASVKEYNSYIRKFPKNITANMFDFEKKGYFESDAGAEDAPEVKF